MKCDFYQTIAKEEGDDFLFFYQIKQKIETSEPKMAASIKTNVEKEINLTSSKTQDLSKIVHSPVNLFHSIFHKKLKANS